MYRKLTDKSVMKLEEHPTSSVLGPSGLIRIIEVFLAKVMALQNSWYLYSCYEGKLI